MRERIQQKRTALQAQRDMAELAYNRKEEELKLLARNLDALTGAIRALDEVLEEEGERAQAGVEPALPLTDSNGTYGGCPPASDAAALTRGIIPCDDSPS